MNTWRARHSHVGRWIASVLLLVAASGALAQDRNYLIVSAPDYVGSCPDAIHQPPDVERFQCIRLQRTRHSREDIKAHIQSLWVRRTPEFLLIVGDTSGTSSTGTTIPHWWDRAAGMPRPTYPTRAWTAGTTGIRICSMAGSR